MITRSSPAPISTTPNRDHALHPGPVPRDPRLECDGPPSLDPRSLQELTPSDPTLLGPVTASPLLLQATCDSLTHNRH